MGRRRRMGGQVAPLLALMLPFLFLFVAVSFAGETVLSTRSHEDSATEIAALAATGDACMSSYTTTQTSDCGGPSVNESFQASADSSVPEVYTAEYPPPQYPPADLIQCPSTDTASECAAMATTPSHVVYQILWCTHGGGGSPCTVGTGTAGGWGTVPGYVYDSCSAATPYSIEVEVNAWVVSALPLAAFIGVNHLVLSSSQVGFGCLGGA